MSPVSIWRAIQGGYLIQTGRRIGGEDALIWVKAGLPTGKNKGDVQIKTRTNAA